MLGTTREKSTTMQMVADEVKVSRDYVEQLTRQLRNAGIVGSKSGINGGVYLKKCLITVSLGEVLKAMEPDRNYAGTDAIVFGVITSALDSVSVASLIRKDK